MRWWYTRKQKYISVRTSHDEPRGSNPISGLCCEPESSLGRFAKPSVKRIWPHRLCFPLVTRCIWGTTWHSRQGRREKYHWYSRTIPDSAVNLGRNTRESESWHEAKGKSGKNISICGLHNHLICFVFLHINFCRSTGLLGVLHCLGKCLREGLFGSIKCTSPA